MPNKQEELNKEESEHYLKVVRTGNMDIMFDFAYSLGQKHMQDHLREGERVSKIK